MTTDLTKEMGERFHALSVMEALGTITPNQLRELDELSEIRDQDPQYEDEVRKRNEQIQALFDQLGFKLKVPLNAQNRVDFIKLDGSLIKSESPLTPRPR
jgi:hypothetical protein